MAAKKKAVKKVKAVKTVAKKKIVAKKKVVVAAATKPRILFMNSDEAAARIKRIESTGRKIAILDVESHGYVYTGEEGKEPVVCLSYATPKPSKLKVVDLIGNAVLRSGLYKINEVKPTSEILNSQPPVVITDLTHVTADTVKVGDESSVHATEDVDNDLPF